MSRARAIEEAPGPVRVSKDAPSEVVYAPVAPVEPGLRLAAWANAFGDFERRRASGTTTINCCTNVPGVPAGLPNTLDLTVRTRTETGGFVGGLDVTGRNLVSPGDGIIVGALTGYISSRLNVRTSSVSRSPDLVGNGSGNLRADLSGPSAGFFATYFNGGFSTDLTFKVDLLDLDETFNDNLAFTANLINGNAVGFGVNSFSGRGSTSLTSASVFGNVNYRFPLDRTFWFEPTAGFNHTTSNYASSAAALGLDDGELLRLQGGARLGADLLPNDRLRMTATLTGLAYSNVHISGGFVQGAGLLSNDILTRSDEGKVRGQGILALNFDFGNGMSSFVQGDVRGGEDLFGVGGRAGVRVQW